MFKNTILKSANNCLMQNYGQIEVEIVSGSGMYVWIRDVEGRGKKCIDFLCGLGVNSLGHCHPAVVEATYSNQ